jgi:hypothetical protein
MGGINIYIHILDLGTLGMESQYKFGRMMLGDIK